MYWRFQYSFDNRSTFHFKLLGDFIYNAHVNIAQGARMSVDEPEARMWEDDRNSLYEARGRGTYYESAFVPSDQMDRAPLLSEVSIL